MSKKTKLILFSTIILIIVAILGLRYYFIKTSLNNYWYNDENKVIYNSKIIECNFSILKPKTTFISEHLLLDDINELKVYFYNMNNVFSLKENNRLFIGVSIIENTTFDKLVEMVKEDCSQFQDDYYNDDVDGISWGYREAETPRPQEEIDKERNEELTLIHSELASFTDEVRSIIRDRYGDWNEMTDDEILKLAENVRSDEEIGRIIIPEWYEIEDEMN